MKRIKFTVGTNYVGSDTSEIVEFDDDATSKDIEERFNEWLWDRLDAGWIELE